MFNAGEEFTLGAEMELQLLDAETLDLSPSATRIFAALEDGHPRIKPEIFQSMIEINSEICRTVQELEANLEQNLATLRTLLPESVRLAAAGSHPFARYGDACLYPHDRNRVLIERNPWAARRILIFGLHLHIGVRDGHNAVATINGLLPYLPHFLALSASSPFWQGEDSGLASTRITAFETIPTMGHPPLYRSWSEFESLYEGLLADGSIESIKDLWWDLRPHPEYGTVELRICDGLPTLPETMAVAAIFQALVRRLRDEIAAGRNPEPPPDWLIRENKWRASHHGLDAEILLDTTGRIAPLRDEVWHLIESLRSIASEFGSTGYLATAARMLEEGCSYERQRHILQATGSIRAVAESLITELQTGRPEIVLANVP
jgi:carboxylate-amine ligase